MFMNKRSQAEIMGLLVIVILVVVAMIFVIQFSMSRKPDTLKEYSDIEIANNMLTSLLQTTTKCHGLTFTDLLKDCATDIPEIRCPPDNKDSCEYVNDTINDLFGKTLNVWGRDYEFSAVLPDRLGNPIILTRSSGACAGDINPAHPHLISVKGSIMTVYLDICD